MSSHWNDCAGVLRRARGRRLLMLAGLALALVLPASADQRPRLSGLDVQRIEVQAKSLASFDRSKAERRWFGRLEFRGGLVLTSSERRFGGLSGIMMAPDGRSFTAIGDEGTWLSGEIDYDGRAPKALKNVRLGPLLGRNGRPLGRKRDSDAEGIALLSGTLKRGIAIVAFERNHRIARYPVVDGQLGVPQGVVSLPPEARKLKSNSGIEALTVMRGGRYKGSVLAFAEEPIDSSDRHAGWLWVNGRPKRISVPVIGGFALTGATGLDDGSVILLERRFRITEGVQMRARLLPAEQIRPDATIEGETLLSADMGFEIDNMEAIGVHTTSDGATVLTIVSDNNFNSFLQRTLLLQFTLAARKPD